MQVRRRKRTKKLKNSSGKDFREDEDHRVLFISTFFPNGNFVTDMLEQTLILAFQISGEGSENSGYGQFWSFFSWISLV